MRKVLLYSGLLVVGLVVGQLLPQVSAIHWVIRVLAMVALSFIMVHVGYEFDIDKDRPRAYVWDAVVASTAAAIPWVLCALYFVFVLAPREMWGHVDLWRASLFQSLFAAPTSAGVLFAMLAAAGLTTSWVFKKARVLAIFDDLAVILLLVPLTAMMVGLKWQLLMVIVVLGALLWAGWHHLHRVRLPVSWPFVLVYAAGIAACSELVLDLSRWIDAGVPIHIEVLLPAFVFGCVLARRPSLGSGGIVRSKELDDSLAREAKAERRASSVLSGCFMVLVGLSMPTIFDPGAAATALAMVLLVSFDGVSAHDMAIQEAMPSVGMLAVHVFVVTLLANVGKLFPALCYRSEVSLRQRLALSVAMFPRGEVGAGVLVVSIGYGMGGGAVTVAVLSLVLNLLGTGAFILVVRRLLAWDRCDGGRGENGIDRGVQSG